VEEESKEKTMTNPKPKYFRTALREETADKMFAAVETIYLAHLQKAEGSNPTASTNSKKSDIKAMLKLVAADLEIVLDAVEDDDYCPLP